MALRDIKLLLPLKIIKYFFMRMVAGIKRRRLKNIKIEGDFDVIIKNIIESKKSVSRFGDSELRVMLGIDPGDYQSPDANISRRLKQVLSEKNDNLLVGINQSLKTFKNVGFVGRYYFSRFICKYIDKIVPFLNPKIVYIDSSFSRIYVGKKNKKLCQKRFETVKRIWDSRDVVIVEGEFSRVGVGNDLFDNAKRVRRILAPSKNAFSVYADILSEIEKLDSKSIIILALGSTATILASDLSKKGFQALDLGHIDLEYEWFLLGAEGAVPIPGKYSNEAPGEEKVVGELPEMYLKEYRKSIIKEIGLR